MSKRLCRTKMMIWSLRMRKAQYLKVEVFSLFSRLFPPSPLRLSFSSLLFSPLGSLAPSSLFTFSSPHFHSSLPTCIPYIFLSSLPASFPLPKPSSLPPFLPPSLFLSSSQVFLTALLTPSFLPLRLPCLPPSLFPLP